MKEAIELFNNYYNEFNHELDGVYRKYDHTFRVVKYAQEIAKSLNLNEEDYDLASRCALFHDISRFKQWQNYQTFEDDLSFDHGDEGYNILKELGIDDEIVLLSTKYHNKYEVPSDLDDRTKMFCNITRDADKIDIMIEQCRVFDQDEVILPEDALESIRNHKLIKNDPNYSKSQAFCILRCIAFIFDMNYKESIEFIKDKNIINDKCDLVINKTNDERFIEIKDICNKYIYERISD